MVRRGSDVHGTDVPVLAFQLPGSGARPPRGRQPDLA